MKLTTISRKVVAGVATLVVGASLLPTVGAQAASSTPDGSSSDKAAASCYEIKQNNPDAESGSYWLYTPQMQAPQQFYCDQETDGGGWVLIGRGREGWSEDYAGKGKAADLASNPDGTDAFSPVQLDSATVDGLLGGQKPSDLDDGVRFRRATNTAGTSWQNLYANRDNTERWSWALQGYATWSNIRFQNPSSIGSNYTASSAIGRIGNWGNSYNTLAFTSTSSFGWKLGFSYGTYVSGSSSSSSYLWTPTGYSAMPFTQVYVRPKLTQDNAGFTQIADSGAAAEQQTQLPNNYSATMKWRTSTETGTGNVSELNTQVQAITQVGDTVFTGGDFKNLVSASGETVNQSYLAGFNVNSAELVRSFTPTFNGQIKAIEGLSNGKLAVGGEFTQVNGEDVAGFVVLDPTTGEIDRTYDWVVENRLTSGITSVKSIQEINGYLYIGGAFTHVKGNTSTAFTYARSAARFNMSTGSVDWKWRPNFNGTVNGINAAEDGSAVYAAGYFSTLGGQKTWKLASINPTDGTLLQSWDWKLSYISTTNPSRMGFQFDVQDAGDTVWTGGAEHLIAQYYKSDLSRKSSSITKSGGDFQDLYLDKTNNVLYGSCHCGDWIYEGGETHDSPWSENKNIDMIRLTAAFDPSTGEVLPQFNPNIRGAKGYGVWESFVDSTGVLWVGGDITKTMGVSGTQNTVGFARYAPRDVTPAAAPKNLSVSTENSTDKLTWDSGTSSKTAYEVLRNDRVIATVTDGTSYSVEHTDGARYFVRSVDNAGNYSETTSVAVAESGVQDAEEVAEPTASASASASATPTEEATSPADDETTPADDDDEVTEVDPAVARESEVIAMGSSWNYIMDGYRTSNTWKNLNTSVTGWKEANAPMGWNTTNLTTRLGQNLYWQPTSIFARKEVNIDSLEGYSKLTLKVRVDDGAAVYVNGTEVKRVNLSSNYSQVPAYALATADRSDSTAQNELVTIEVPVSALRQGKNTIAVQTHGQNNWRSGVSFDLSATLQS